MLTLPYTSSDESDVSEDEDGVSLKLKGYLVKKFTWGRSVLRKAKKELDAKYIKKPATMNPEKLTAQTKSSWKCP